MWPRSTEGSRPPPRDRFGAAVDDVGGAEADGARAAEIEQAKPSERRPGIDHRLAVLAELECSAVLVPFGDRSD